MIDPSHTLSSIEQENDVGIKYFLSVKCQMRRTSMTCHKTTEQWVSQTDNTNNNNNDTIVVLMLRVAQTSLPSYSDVYYIIKFTSHAFMNIINYKPCDTLLFIRRLTPVVC